MLDEHLATLGGLFGVRGERAGIDGPHRGTAQDIERDRAADVLGDLFENVDHDPHLVGASRCSSRQNERYQTAGHDFDASRSRGEMKG